MGKAKGKIEPTKPREPDFIKNMRDQIAARQVEEVEEKKQRSIQRHQRVMGHKSKIAANSSDNDATYVVSGEITEEELALEKYKQAVEAMQPDTTNLINNDSDSDDKDVNQFIKSIESRKKYPPKDDKKKPVRPSSSSEKNEICSSRNKRKHPDSPDDTMTR